VNAVLIVAAGGAIGSVLRYLIGAAALRAGAEWPIGTTLVNLAGCLLVGLFAGLAVGRPAVVTPAWRLFLIVGLCGGFTTFSALGLETFDLIRDGKTVIALLNATGQLAIGVVLVWIGIAISKLL
jgi:CrcB protein